MKKTGKLCAGYRTYIGNTREENQDSVLVRILQQKQNYFVVAAVCDGIGGLEHGELASQTVVEQIESWFQSICSWIEIDTVDIEILICHLKDLAEECNFRVRELRQENNIQTGTTLSLFMMIRNFYFIVQVGDSRVYLYREHALCQLTVDASVTKLKNGRLKQYLDNYVGKSEELWFSSEMGEVMPKDIFIICSDGFYHHFREEDMEQYATDIRNPLKLDHICDVMIHNMMERGERDNISVEFIAV